MSGDVVMRDRWVYGLRGASRSALMAGLCIAGSCIVVAPPAAAVEPKPEAAPSDPAVSPDVAGPAPATPGDPIGRRRPALHPAHAGRAPGPAGGAGHARGDRRCRGRPLPSTPARSTSRASLLRATARARGRPRSSSGAATPCRGRRPRRSIRRKPSSDAPRRSLPRTSRAWSISALIRAVIARGCKPTCDAAPISCTCTTSIATRTGSSAGSAAT